jgi:hypothetical protein
MTNESQVEGAIAELCAMTGSNQLGSKALMLTMAQTMISIIQLEVDKLALLKKERSLTDSEKAGAIAYIEELRKLSDVLSRRSPHPDEQTKGDASGG